MTIARDFGVFLTRTTYGDLPEQAVDHASMLIASAASGKEIQSAAIIRDLSRERGGTPEASIWFDAGPRLPAIYAARVNALMSDAPRP